MAGVVKVVFGQEKKLGNLTSWVNQQRKLVQEEQANRMTDNYPSTNYWRSSDFYIKVNDSSKTWLIPYKMPNSELHSKIINTFHLKRI